MYIYIYIYIYVYICIHRSLSDEVAAFAGPMLASAVGPVAAGRAASSQACETYSIV